MREALPILRRRWSLDLVVANAENASSGSGLDPKGYQQLIDAGVSAITMGDHVYKKKEILPLFAAGAPICRPANFPLEAPGPDHVLVSAADGVPVAVITVLGRLFMRPVDCPLHAIDRVLASIGERARVVLVDVHAEATSEKQVMLRHLAGRVTAVLGTHTHVPTADAAIFPPGTAYITDAGMTGPYDGVIGRRWDRVLKTAWSFEPTFFDIASGDLRISGVLITVDPESARAMEIRLVHLTETDIQALG